MKLANFLAAHALRAPNREALKSGEASLTFAQLHTDSTRMANALIAAGVQVGDRVALFIQNRIEFPVCFIAVVKAGAIAVTPNPKSTLAELEFIVADAAPAAFIYDSVTRAQLDLMSGGCWKSAVRFDIDADQFSEQPSDGVSREVPPEFDDCMISYTSGTTGRPKGAILTQANYITSNCFLNALQWQMGPEDRILTTTPFAHRTAFARLMNVICLGSSLVMMDKMDVQQAIRLIESERITVLGMVTTVARMLLPEIEASPHRFRSLRKASVTGEAFPAEIKRRILKALPDLKLFSFFAMTEVGAITLLSPEEQLAKGGSVGRVNPGVELKLVDDEDREVERGEPGEILVRCGPAGSYLTMRGYFNRPEETASTVTNGWVRTGDIGKFDDEGYLYIVDRKKDMVLSGGYNIYSKEVEACICELTQVADASVVGVSDDMFGESVAAFVELHPGKTLDAAEVIDYCRERISSYKKPKFVFFMPALPRNSMGKVLKAELRRMAAAAKA